MHSRTSFIQLVGSIVLVLFAAARAPAQCNPALFEIGGEPGAVCTANINYQAVARGRFVSVESTPLTGAPSVAGRVALDHPAIHMHTEILGRIWAIDGLTLYGLNTSTPASPQILSRYSLPAQFADRFDRVRVKGNFVYAISSYKLFIFDVTNPAAPALRSSFALSSAYPNDLEVVGSYAYLSIWDVSGAGASLMVVDVGNPQAPFEVRRLGNAERQGYRVTSRSGMLYALARNNAAGAIEAWSLATASNPALLSVNATISVGDISHSDELRVTSSAVAYVQLATHTLRLYNTVSLAQIGAPIVFPYAVRGMTVDSPFVYLTRSSGELARINISTPSAPVISQSYLDVPPGWTFKVATLNEGFSVLTGNSDLWVFRTPPGGQPTLIAHLAADAGYEWVSNHVVLLSGGTLLAVETASGPAQTTWIIAYNVVTTPTPGVQFVGAYQVPEYIHGIDAGFDASNTRRIYYTTGSFGTGYTLRILNATNLGAMTQTGAFALTSNVYGPLRFLPGNIIFNTPPRVLVGGSDRTQIVSVASAAFPSSLGVIPSGARALSPGLYPTVWLVDDNMLRGYDISTPSAPVHQSSIRLANDLYGYGTDVKLLNPFGAIVGVTTSYGDLVQVNVQNPGAPFIAQIARITSNLYSGYSGGLAYDGTNVHVANGEDGYTVLPISFSAPPREDPNFAIHLPTREGILPMCPGSPFVLTARFVANPAASSHQWFKYNPATQSYAPLSNGATGTGSSISGATSATLTISNPGGGDIGYYYSEASNTCGTGRTFGVEARLGGYANCDNSTTLPALNVNDFICFQQRFATGAFYADCDQSNSVNVNDFICFQQQFAAACN